MVISVVTVSMYLLATAYWAYSVADVAARVQEYMKDPQQPPTSTVTRWYTLFNAVVLINVCILPSNGLSVSLDLFLVYPERWNSCVESMGDLFPRPSKITPHPHRVSRIHRQ